jgi:catechol 2,3-dioxygenase-like lactoylglutathione lyase family enzyme
VDFKLEVAVIPVTDVDLSKDFFKSLGWRLDADFVVGPDFRIVQFTPPGSAASIHFGSGVTSSPAGTANVYLIVTDVEAARAQLADRGVDVSEVFHYDEMRHRVSGADPARGSYNSFATFTDPDGNTFTLQEITSRLPGR